MEPPTIALQESEGSQIHFLGNSTSAAHWWQWLIHTLSNDENYYFGRAFGGLDLRLLLALPLLYLVQRYRSSSVKPEIKEIVKSRSAAAGVGADGASSKFYAERVLHSPIKLPYLDGAITLLKLRKYGVKILEEWVQKYGSGGLFYAEAGLETVVVITDALIVQKILSSSEPGHLNKPRKLYDKIFVEWLKEGLVNSEYEKWSTHRRILSRAFAYKSLQTYLKFIMNEHAKNLASDLMSNCSKDEEGDILSIGGEKMYDLIYFHTIKIISQILLGNQSCTDEESTAFHLNLHEYKECVLYRFLHPELFIEPIWMLHPKKRAADKLVKWCNAFTLKIINKYKEKRDLDKGLDKELELEEETAADIENENCGIKPLRCMIEEMLSSGVSDKEILDEVGTFMSAGHETTACAIQMLMFNLASNPEHQERCRQEVDALFDSKLVGSDFDYDLNMDDLSTSLKYLERCIFESGRITPTVPIFARKLESSLQISESLEFPAGSTVVMLPWTMHRDSRHYQNPEQFIPDRFLPEVVKQRHPGAYIPFSGGNRNCIGWKLAIMEMKVIMAWMLRYFEISTTDGPDDVRLFFDITLSPERLHNIVLRRRNHINHANKRQSS